MQRILVIHSTSDPGVDDRIAAMAKKPELAGYELHHAYFIQPEDGPELSRLKPSEFLSRNEMRILGRFERNIQATKSELVVLHSGIAFSIAPESVMTIFSELKNRNPQLRFAVQNNALLGQLLESQSPHFVRQIDEIFDRGPEMTNLVKLMF